MDLNLTGFFWGMPFNLTGSAYQPLIYILLGGVVGALVAGAAKLIGDWLNRKRDREDERNRLLGQLRGQKSIAYCDLMGCSHSMLQYYNSYLFSVISAEYLIPHARIFAIKRIDLTPIKGFLLQGKKELAGHYFNTRYEVTLEKSIDLKEGLRSRERTLDLEIQLGETSERFWRSIGQVKALFPDAVISNLVEEIKSAEQNLELVESIQDAFGKIGEEINDFSLIISAEISAETLNKDLNEIRDDWANKKEINLEKTHNLKNSDVKTKVRNLDLKVKKLLDYLEKLEH